jgi:hypothetical protein
VNEETYFRFVKARTGAQLISIFENEKPQKAIAIYHIALFEGLA